MYNTMTKGLIMVTVLASFTARVSEGCPNLGCKPGQDNVVCRLRGPFSIKAGDKFEMEFENSRMKNGNELRMIPICHCNLFVCRLKN